MQKVNPNFWTSAKVRYISAAFTAFALDINYIFTGQATADIKITQVSNFAVIRPEDIWGFPALKTRKFAKKFPKLQTFSPRRGESLARFQ